MQSWPEACGTTGAIPEEVALDHACFGCGGPRSHTGTSHGPPPQGHCHVECSERAAHETVRHFPGHGRFQGQGAQHASGGAAPPRRQVSNVGCEGGGVPKPSARNSVDFSPQSIDFRRQDSGGAPASVRPLCSRAARCRGRERASVRGRLRKTEMRQRQE